MEGLKMPEIIAPKKIEEKALTDTENK